MPPLFSVQNVLARQQGASTLLTARPCDLYNKCNIYYMLHIYNLFNK